MEGNLKLTLGLIWSLILRYKIQVKATPATGDTGKPTESSGNKELLEWVNSVIPQYHIKNFTSDWQNGQALCSLAEALLPGQMTLPQDFSGDPVKDARMGIDKAHSNMNIPVIVDPEDVAHDPDQLAMITYISYFREFAQTKVIQKTTPPEQIETPVPDNCIVYGPGLETGPNDQGIETYFTIEIRNAENRRVPKGGHDVGVKITGPHSQYTFNAIDNKDGTYYVRYTPQEDGNYVIEVTLNKKHISGSPYHVTINKVKGPTDTLPVAHWYYFSEKEKKTHTLS